MNERASVLESKVESEEEDKQHHNITKSACMPFRSERQYGFSLLFVTLLFYVSHSCSNLKMRQ
jgi:hypothetical protein